MNNSKLANKSPAKCAPPRILHLVHSLNFGGIETWLLAVLQNMPRDRFAMDVCYKGPQPGDLAPQARQMGAELLHCPLGPTVLPFIQRLKGILRSRRYSLLHVHTQAHSGPAVCAAKTVGVPVITTFYNTQQPPQTKFTRLPGISRARSIYARFSMRYALQNSSASNGVSRAVAEAVVKATGVERSRCGVFCPGSARPQLTSADCIANYRDELGLLPHQRVIIHVGSFKRQKNHLAILQILGQVVQTMPEVVLLLAGDGLLRPNIQEQVRRLKLDQHVRFLGNRRDATALMQLGEVFLFPSLHEGLSISLMEASAVGLPIVASNIASNREATGDGKSARLHDVADIDGMAASAVELLQIRRESDRLAEHGRRIYEQSFSIEASVERLVTLYDRVLHRRRRHNITDRIAA